jgi:Protein tyrosine and serine/threonine kinase/C2 domain
MAANVGGPGKVRIEVIEARNLIPCDSNNKSDPFAVVRFNKDSKTKEVTNVIKKTLNPVWKETFEFSSSEPLTDRIAITVWDYDRFSPNDFEGHMSVPVMACAAKPGEPMDQWFPLLDKKRESKAKSKKDRGEIHLIMTFTPKGKSAAPAKGTAAAAATPEPAAAAASGAASGSHRPTQAGHVEGGSGRWEIVYEQLSFGKELGRGAFGVVFRGKWRLQDVAIKQLHQQSMDEAQLKEFRDECSLMMNLRPHRNVVPLLGVCTDPVNPFCLVIDFVEGGTLEGLLKSQFVISWRLALDICKGMCAGVHHLHSEHILHRDLAARNILLRANYEPLIADFGLSKKVDPVLGSDKRLVQTKEATAIRGPYKWMAPESLDKNEFSVKSDAWSFGVVVWELISRSEPFPEFDIFEAAQKIVHEHARLPIPPNTPTKFVNMMTWCWRTSPNDRPDFVQIASALADIELVVDSY